MTDKPTQNAVLTPPPVPAEMGDIIAQYVRLRDALKAADDAHAAKTKAVREYKALLEQAMIAKLNAEGANSVNSDAGTAYLTHRKSATLADPALFRQFIINTQQYDLVDWRANAPQVAEWIDKVGQGNPPPGVTYSTAVTVGVRRS